MAKSEDLQNKIKQLDSQFEAALDNYSEIYQHYKVNPGFSSYQTEYAKSMGELDNIRDELVSIISQSRQETDIIADKIEYVDVRIEELDKENKVLRARNDVLVGAKNASVGQMESYRDDYRNNIFSLVALIGASVLISKSMF
tara:strand:- start:497 stop:922 length:426 start_codon:yes stop_codon:yes gene_type:complete